jgi:AraC-like DNA-binding protein
MSEARPQRPPSPAAFSVRSDDVDEARTAVGRVLWPHRLEVTGDPARFAAELDAVALGPLTIGRLRYGTGVRLEADRLGAYLVVVPATGAVAVTCDAERVAASPAVAAVCRPDHGASLAWDATAPVVLVRIARRALEHELEQLLDRPLAGPVDVRSRLDVATGRGAQWWSLVRGLAADLDRGPEPSRDAGSLLRQPAVAAPLAHGVMTGLLLAASHRHRDELDRPVPAVSASVVRRAREFIEGHAQEPLTVADIARGAGVGVRGLQHGFRRSLGMSPTEYLRQVRLRRVHEELRTADSAATTVAQIAARWGFPHQGRFAVRYRERYGVGPALTLRGRP